MIAAAWFLAFMVVVCIALVVACFYLMDEQGATIKDLRAANQRLYADNQRLTESLVRKEGGYVDLKPLSEMPPIKVQHAPPYWKSREPRQVQVGDKIVQLG